MFLGKQNGKIVLAKNTREEIENVPCMVFDEIVETDVDYTFYNGEYLTPAELEIKQKENRRKELIIQLDELDAKCIRALRALQAGTGTEEDAAKLRDLELQATQIREDLHDLGD